jgi:hypothetical protein
MYFIMDICEVIFLLFKDYMVSILGFASQEAK